MVSINVRRRAYVCHFMLHRIPTVCTKYVCACMCVLTTLNNDCCVLYAQEIIAIFVYEANSSQWIRIMNEIVRICCRKVTFIFLCEIEFICDLECINYAEESRAFSTQ